MDLAQKCDELKNSDIFENLDFMKSGYVYNGNKNIQISTQYNDVSIPGVKMMYSASHRRLKSRWSLSYYYFPLLGEYCIRIN